MAYVWSLSLLLLAIAAAIADGQTNTSNVTSASARVQIPQRREAIILDSTPVDSNLYRRQSKVIYRRVSRNKGYAQPMRSPRKPRYGPPRHKYGPPNNQRRPTKKQKGIPIKTKYGTPNSKAPQNRYARPPSKHYRKPIYGLVKPVSPYLPQEPAGFGEPPSDRFSVRNPKPIYGNPPKIAHSKQPIKPPTNTYNNPPKDSYGKPPKPSFGEPPKNSYGEPPQSAYGEPPKNSYGEPPQIAYEETLKDSYGDPIINSAHQAPGYAYQAFGSNVASASETHTSFHTNEQSFSSNQADSYLPNTGNTANSYPELHIPTVTTHPQYNIGPSYTAQENDIITGNNNTPSVDYKEYLTNNVRYESRFPHTLNVKKYHHSSYKPLKGKSKLVNPIISINGPIKGPRGKHHSEELLVGGQYAEPPARYVPKFRPSTQMHAGADSLAPPGKTPQDSDESGSAHRSSYVNYKNSNIAFSPQNLNDAFSIKSM